MYDNINEIPENLPKGMKGLSATPAQSNLFKIDDNSIEIWDETTAADLFHHYTTQLLFLYPKCGRPDLQTVVLAFLLCTQLQKPGTPDD